jgi:hypothetical protein
VNRRGSLNPLAKGFDMPIQVTKSKVEALMKRADSLQSKVKSANKKAEQLVMQFVETGITYGASFGFGFLDGRFGGAEIGGMPGALLFGALTHGAAFFDLGGPQTAKFLHAAGNGALANHAASLGGSMGRVMAIKAKELNPTTGKRKGDAEFTAPTDEQVKSAVGGASSSGARMLSDAEVRAFANAT